MAIALTASCGKSNSPAPSASWSKAQWIQDAIASIKSGRYPRLQAISYWHEQFQNGSVITNTRIDTSPATLSAFKAAISDPVFVSTPVFSANKLGAPGSGGIYFSAFPDFTNTEDQVTSQRISEFEGLAGKSITWAYFSNNWFNGSITFPSAQVATIHSVGRVPFVRMMMRSNQNGGQDPYYSLANVISGTYDSALTAWATAAKNLGYPILVEFGTEVTLDLFPWNGRWNGADGATYGTSALPDGPARFRDAYRHIVSVCNTAGATNITWFYHVDAHSNPDASWNTIAAYYPGDAYVDWIGVSVYGPEKPTDPYVSFSSLMDDAYAQLTAVSATKPIAVLEFGVTEP